MLPFLPSLRHLPATVIIVGGLAVGQTSPANNAPAGYSKEADITRSGSSIHLSANSPRPLEQAISALQSTYGWFVSYEDPRFEHASDLAEASDSRYGSGQKTATSKRVPNGHTFTVDFPAGTTPGAAPDQEKSLRAIVDAYNQSKNPGHFELRSLPNGGFSIVGIGAHNKSGEIGAQTPILDTLITIPTKEQTATRTARLFCQSLSAASHTTVALGVYPVNLLEHNLVRVGGTRMAARTMLANLATATSRQFAWQLLYDPDTKSYFLNLHIVRPVTKSN